PMPEQMTRPSAARIRSTASAKLSPRLAASASSAADSTCSTRWPVSMARERSGAVPCCGSMGKDVLLGPAGKNEHCSLWQEAEAGLGHFQPPCARQPPVQLCLKLVQIENVRSRIFHLCWRQFGSAPIAGLLGLGDVDAK